VSARVVWTLAVCALLSSACQSTSDRWQPTTTARAALQLPANRQEGARIYQACASCHGDDGAGNDAALVPRIAGQHYSVLIAQMTDFRAARRHDRRMQQAMADHRLDSPQALADVATYVNLLKSSAPVSMGGAYSGDLGQRLYETNCARCHGGAAQGEDASVIPRLSGQNRMYLLRQFRDIAALLRPPAGRSHAALLSPLDYQEREALADYLSRLR
jgi:cytochrome c553